MKKMLFTAALLAMVFAGCKKDDEKDPETPSTPPTAPTSYTQKIVLEYFSGTWCGWCPDGVTYAKNLLNANPNISNYVVIHNSGNDPMQTTESAALANLYAGGYPTGMINRIGSAAASRSQWNSQATIVKSQTPTMGLAIDATNSDKIKVKIGIGGGDLAAGTYKLHVYAVAKSVTRNLGQWPNVYWDQTNYLYQKAGYEASPYFTKGDYYLTTTSGGKLYFIANYPHEQVLADVLTADFNGDVLASSALKKGKITEFTYTLVEGQYTTEDFQIIAFVSTTSSSVPVLNAQWVNVGSKVNFD
jgi:hypothetical protein